jgi:hypothetical protein
MKSNRAVLGLNKPVMEFIVKMEEHASRNGINYRVIVLELPLSVKLVLHVSRFYFRTFSIIH